MMAGRIVRVPIEKQRPFALDYHHVGLPEIRYLTDKIPRNDTRPKYEDSKACTLDIAFVINEN